MKEHFLPKWGSDALDVAMLPVNIQVTLFCLHDNGRVASMIEVVITREKPCKIKHVKLTGEFAS